MEMLMGRKTILFAIVSIVILVLLFLLFKGCGSGGGSSGFSLGGGSVDTSDFEDWLLEIYEDDEEFEEQLLSLTLINDAYHNKKEITEEEYYILRVQEAFDHKNLPDEYKSVRIDRRDNSFLLLMINDRIDDFSEETQDILRPFVTNPDDPESYWYKINQDDESLAREFLDIITIVPSANAMDNEHPMDGKFQVHYDDPFITDKADIVKAALEYSYNKYVNIGMKEPTDWIYVKIQSLGDDGQQYMDEHEGEERCHILISTSQSDDALKTSTAHELFHCFQQYIPLKSYSTEEWIWESTATWSEDFTYPTVNTEHGFDSNIFPYFNKDFFDSDNVTYHQYGSYLWPWFLSHKYGKDGLVVKKMLDEAALVGMKDAIKNRPDFYEEFKQYALYNYNTEPFKFYYDHNNKPTKKPYGQSRKKKTFSNREKFNQDVNLDSGGIMYYYYFFEDDIERVEFDFTTINIDSQPDLATQIVYKIGEHWFYQDVSEIKKLKFCRKRPPEEIDVAVVIVGNANLDNLAFTQFDIDAEGKCAPEWSGYTSYSWSYTNTVDMSGLTLSGDPGIGTWDERGYMMSRDTLVYDEDNDEFVIKDQMIYYSYDDAQHISYTRDCGLQWESDTNSLMGSSHNKWEVDDKYPSDSGAPTRLEASDDNPAAYEVSLNVYDWNVDWLTSSWMNSELSRTCDFWGITTPDPAGFYRDESTSKSDSIGKEPNNPDVLAELNNNATRLSGAGLGNFQYGDTIVPVQIVVDYAWG
jgi:hypothetical protein